MKRLQSRKWSAIETVTSTVSGFLVSQALLYGLVKLWNLPLPPSQQAIWVTVFTIASLVRGYVLRRFFNWIHAKFGY